MMTAADNIHLFIRKYLTFYLPVARKMSSATIKTYKQSLNCFISYLAQEKHIPFEKLTFDDLSVDNIYAFTTWLRDCKHESINTLNLRLTAIKTFLHYCGDNDIALMDYYLKAASIHEFKGTKNPSVEYLSQGQLKLLFAIPDTKTRLGRRNRFLMILSYETGMRMNELLNLRLCDILESDNETRIRIHGKGNKIRYIPLLSGAEAHLQAYLKEFHPHKNEQDYLFYTIHNGFKTQMKSGTVDALLKKYAKKAAQTDPKFPLNLHEHMLRHSIAMTMYKKGIPISYIRDFLGHSSIESTQIYAYADEETIRKTLESVSTILDKNKPAPQKIWKGKEESLLEFCGLV